VGQGIGGILAVLLLIGLGAFGLKGCMASDAEVRKQVMGTWVLTGMDPASRRQLTFDMTFAEGGEMVMSGSVDGVRVRMSGTWEVSFGNLWAKFTTASANGMPVPVPKEKMGGRVKDMTANSFTVKTKDGDETYRRK
jgi:hypothetical protein